MIPKYLYLYIFGSSSITMLCKNPNPNVIRSLSHVPLLFFLPTATFLVHALFRKIALISAFFCFQQAPNTDMWLSPTHLTKIFDLPGHCLEFFLELYYLCLCLHGLLLECVHYLDYIFVTDQFHALFLCLCYMRLCFLFLFQGFCYLLLKRFHLSLMLFLLCLCNCEFCLQILHVLCPFDVLCDGHSLLPLLEVLDSYAYPFFILVPLLDFLILL
jgi:hypothetical protein